MAHLGPFQLPFAGLWPCGIEKVSLLENFVSQFLTVNNSLI
jgi:hypothetical protein